MAASGTLGREDNGRFKHHGGWDRLCVCGHTLGVHSAAKVAGERPCFNADCPGGTGEDCDCLVFRPSKRKSKMETDKPIVKLVGNDGNAFSIMASCSRAAKKAKWPQAKIDAVLTEMKAGDYDHLLQTAMKHFEVE